MADFPQLRKWLLVLKEKLKEENEIPKILFGVPEGYKGLVLARKSRECSVYGGIHVHICLDDTGLSGLKESLSFFAPDCKVCALPAWDCLPYDRVSPNNEIVAQRIDALATLMKWREEKSKKPRVLLTTVNAVLQRVIPQTCLRDLKLDIVQGETIALEKLLNFLTANGYTRTDTVREAGEYAVRGGIVDLFPSGNEMPVRVDLFGDNVESLRFFDPLSQRSQEKVAGFSLRPATEYLLSEEMINRFRSGYRQHFGAVNIQQDPLYAAVSEGRKYNGMDHWLPLFYSGMQTVFDYVPEASLSLDFHTLNAAEERLNQIQDFYQARKTMETANREKSKQKKGEVFSGTIYHPLAPDALYLVKKEWEQLLSRFEAEQFSPFSGPELERSHFQTAGAVKGRNFADIRALQDGDVIGALKTHLQNLIISGKKCIITAYSNGARERLKALLGSAGIDNIKICDNYDALKNLKYGQIALIVLGLETGFVNDDLAVLTEQDILGDRLTRQSKKRRKADQFLKEISSLNPGDLVVHVDHGIGRFEKLETLKADKVLHDCLQIIYNGGDKLYVPVENIDVLSRFGHDEGIVQLDRLGGAGWQARKAKVKKDLMRMAETLLAIAADRQLKHGEKLHADEKLYRKFVSRFPYPETEDQQKAIEETLESLNSDKPMDRLICGDVGFGKTEVALRAAYVAVMSAVQVAVIVPTTLLARQHTKTFKDRFAGTGLRIEQLSRLLPAKELKQIKDGMADGSVNIVIGTHALLSKTVKFAHLGLMIVDEEQKFGVKQKERLKEMKSDVHVLTMTATPIPRTLQLSLTGVKELSLIATPPVDRLAIRTFVLPFDPVVVREAILREFYRGGQIFYVCPRVSDLKDVEARLHELVPEVRTVTAHGQLAPTDLEDRMNAFYDGQYHVLLATNIIESGLDIPTANTMIIHRADMFGLAQLYQIRGRIGRSKVRAYAYLTYSPDKSLTANAQKRLEIMETLDNLGAGFQLASHDMDIRGAGNVLGEEQSGHIKEVGIELYQQMLEDAVAAAREGRGLEHAETQSEAWSPHINLGNSVLIPEEYIEDLNIRMSLYRRLGELKTKEHIEDFAAELIDRFGEYPPEVDNLMRIVEIKQLCLKAGIDKVEAGPKGIIIGFYKDNPPNLQGLVEWMAKRQGTVTLRADQKLAIVRHCEKPVQRVRGVHSLIRELAELH